HALVFRCVWVVLVCVCVCCDPVTSCCMADENQKRREERRGWCLSGWGEESVCGRCVFDHGVVCVGCVEFVVCSVCVCVCVCVCVVRILAAVPSSVFWLIEKYYRR